MNWALLNRYIMLLAKVSSALWSLCGLFCRRSGLCRRWLVANLRSHVTTNTGQSPPTTAVMGWFWQPRLKRWGSGNLSPPASSGTSNYIIQSVKRVSVNYAIRPSGPETPSPPVILGAALALPSYLNYEAFHSFTKHRFLCNLTSGSNVYIPSNTSIQQVAETARPPGHGPEGLVADDRKNDLPVTSCSPAILKTHCESDNEVSLFYTSLWVSDENSFR
jgi:hypothetical protein